MFVFLSRPPAKECFIESKHTSIAILSQPFFLFAFPNTTLSGLVCKAVLDLRLKLLCKESPKASQFSSIHIYSASGTALGPRDPEVNETLHCCWRQCNFWGDSHKTQSFLTCSGRANIEVIPGTWGYQRRGQVLDFVLPDHSIKANTS